MMHVHGYGGRGVGRLGRVLLAFERSKSGAVLSYSTSPNDQDKVTSKTIETIDMTCLRLAHSGKGVCYEDGQSKVTLVQGALPGETLRAEIQKVKKRFAEGRKVAVLTPAPGARDAPCPHNTSCGGCTLLELPYHTQLHAKVERLLYELETNVGLGQANATALFEGIVACPLELRYRNKSAFMLTQPSRRTPGGPSICQLGMTQARSNSVFPVQACLLHSTNSDAVLAAINAALSQVPGGIMWYDEVQKRGFIKRVTLREGFPSVEALRAATAAAESSSRLPSAAGHLGSGEGASGSACAGETGLQEGASGGGGSVGVTRRRHDGLHVRIDRAAAEAAVQGTTSARVAGQDASVAGRGGQSAKGSAILVNFMTTNLGTRKEQAALHTLVRALEKVPFVGGVVQSMHTVHSKTAPAEHSVCLSGQDHLFIGIGTLAYRVSAHSYLQVNTLQCAELYRKIVDLGQLRSSDIVLDLYCGVGSIALWLAGHCAHVIGVEIIEAAVFDAQENARLNGVTNSQFVVGDLATFWAGELLAGNGANEADVVVVDPARAGLSTQVLDYLGKCKARAVVYVSCNSLSLCRDLKGLAGMGWQCTRVAAVDMFPQTDHLETVARLERAHV